MDGTPEKARLEKKACLDCRCTVVLEPNAKEGDVILCPGCSIPLLIRQVAGVLQFERWRDAPTRPS